MVTAEKRQNSTFYEEKLDNGLQLLGQYIPGVQSSASVFWVNTGTRDEVPKEMGISHFLEHMAFKRTPTFGTDIDHVFEEMGAEHNAATWKEFTYYWARVLSEHTGKSIDVLTDLVRPVLNADDFDEERLVILEEIARYEDNPSHVLFDHFLNDYFGTHPLAMDTLGTQETIKALTVEEMREYHARRYGTNNILFSIAGNFDWDAVKTQVQERTRDWQAADASRPLTAPAFSPSFRVVVKDTLQTQQIAIGSPSVAEGDPRYYAGALMSTILGDDTGSRLYWSLVHEGIAESATAQMWEFDECGVFFVHLATDPEQTQRAFEIAEAELERMQGGDVTQDELDRAKAKLIASEVIRGESTNNRVMALIDSWLEHGRLETLEEIRRKIEAVTVTDVSNYLRDFPIWPQQVITAVGPATGENLRPPTQ